MIDQSLDEQSEVLASEMPSLDNEDPLDLLAPVRTPNPSDQQIVSYSQTPKRSLTQGESTHKRRRITPSLSEWTSGPVPSIRPPDQANEKPDISLSSPPSFSAVSSSPSNRFRDNISVSSSAEIQPERINESIKATLGDLDLSPIPTSDQEEEQEDIFVKSASKSSYWKDAVDRRKEVEINKLVQTENPKEPDTLELNSLLSRNQALVADGQHNRSLLPGLLRESLILPDQFPLPAHIPERSNNESFEATQSDALSSPKTASVPTSVGIPTTNSLLVNSEHSLPPPQSAAVELLLPLPQLDQTVAQLSLLEDNINTTPVIMTDPQTMFQSGRILSSPPKSDPINSSNPRLIASEPTVYHLKRDSTLQHHSLSPTEKTYTQTLSPIPRSQPTPSDINQATNEIIVFPQPQVHISASNVVDRFALTQRFPTSNITQTTDPNPSNPSSTLNLVSPQSHSIIISPSADTLAPVEKSSVPPTHALTDAEVAAFFAHVVDNPPGKRNLRQRTSLQLQPYTRERLAYKQRLAMRGFKDALLNKEEEVDQLRKDKIERRNRNKDAVGQDSLGGWLEEEGDDLLDILEVGEETWTPGKGEASNEEERTALTQDREHQTGDAESEDAVGVGINKGKERAVAFAEMGRSKRTYTRRKVKEKTVALQSSPADQITPGKNPNLRTVHASNISSNAEESQNFDFTAFGIDSPHAQEEDLVSPSLTAPRRPTRSTNRQTRNKLVISDADSTPASDSDSNSDQTRTSSPSSSSPLTQEAAIMILERKKQKILNRMMPAVLAKKHLQDLAKDEAERKALKRAARHVVKLPEGPLRAGQSVVRRALGAAKKPFVIEGDSESSAEEEQAPNVIEQVRHRQLDVILNREVVDSAMVDAMYGTSGELLPETDDEESNRDEDEERAEYLSDEAVEFASNDIRRWIGMPSKQTESVVDQQLSRTAVRSRNDAERARLPGAQPQLSRSRVSDANWINSSRAALNKAKPRKKTTRSAARRKSRPPQIFLDDNSIFGDLQPPLRPTKPNEEPLLRRKAHQAGVRGVSPARARGPAQPQRPNPPIVIRSLTPGLVGQGKDPPINSPLSHRVFARGLSSNSITFDHPSIDRSDSQSSPGVASPGPRVLWDAYAGFSIDFGIIRLPAGLSFPSVSYSRQGHLSELLDLCQRYYLPQEGQLPTSTPIPPPCFAFDLELTADMPLALFSEAFGLIINRLYEAVDPDSQITNHDDDDAQTKVQLTCERAMHFTCSFVTYRRLDGEFVDTFFPAIMDGIESLLERLEVLTTPTSVKHIRNELFFRLHWFLLELATRFALSSSIVLEQIRDSQQSLCSILVRRLLEYDFSRTIRSVKAASLSLAGTNDYHPDVQDSTIELWVSLIHLCPYIDLDLPQGPSFWIAVKTGLQATGMMSSNLLAAEKIWYIVQGVCCISQFNRQGITEDTPFVLPYWPLVSEAVLSVKLEADSIYDMEASSSTLRKRDKYVWTVLSRCYLLGARWGWPLNAKDPILGQLGQKIFKTRKFLNLFSDPVVSDFPLFIRESNCSLLSEVDSSVDSAFHVFIKIIALAVRDTQRSSSQGELTTKQAEKEISRLLAISAPMGKVSFTRTCPPSMRELSTLINRYSFSIVSVLLDPAEATAIHSLRQMRNYLAFEVADFKSRKICIRAMMYMAVLHRHLDLSMQSVAEWLGGLTNILLQELSVIDRTPGTVRPDNPTAPKHELIFCLSLILGSIRHIISSSISSQNDTDRSKTPYPDPVLLHNSWTEGILASPLALEPMTGLEVLRCVQAFLNARRSALSYIHIPIQNPARDSQDEFGAEFADIDMNDPNLLFLLDGPPDNSTSEIPKATNASRVIVMDREFASAVNQTVSPAIYKLLSNMVVDDEAWVQLVGERGSEISREDDSRARDSYVAQLVDCWSGCASVLVQHGLKDWSGYVELGTESWKRFSESATKRQIGLRFMWNLAQMDPSSYEHLKEHYFSVWFQSIVAPASTFTIEPHYTSLLFQMDKLDDPIFFQLSLEQNEHGGFEFDSDKLQAQRLDMLNEIFGNLYVELSRNASGNISLLQRKSYLMSCVRDMLLSMTDHATKMYGTAAGNNYIIFCWDVIARLRNKAELVINERTMRELTFFNTLSVVS